MPCRQGVLRCPWLLASMPGRLTPPAHALPLAPPCAQVIAQCQHCQAWHKLADAANLVEEIRYADLEDE